MEIYTFIFILKSFVLCLHTLRQNTLYFLINWHSQALQSASTVVSMWCFNTQPYFPAMWYCVAHIDPSLYFIDHTNQNALCSLLYDATVYTVIQLKPS